MNGHPLVSIILPTFNREKTLAKAIESALSQTYRDFELLVVDDASQDKTQSILLEYARKDVRIVGIRNEKNSGLVRSLNKGVQCAKGAYIARLDDDDFWLDPRKLEKQVAFFEKHPKCVLTGGGQVRVDEKGKEITRLMFPETDEEIRSRMLFTNPFSHTSVLFRKDAWEKAGRYDETLIFSEDWDLWMKLASVGTCYNFQEYFVCYLEGSQNRSKEHEVRDALLNMRLRVRYRRSFPNFLGAFLFGCLAFMFALAPFHSKARTLWRNLI
ncbi:MAG: hypothetical protein A3B24_00235 [Candidatus Wildermuthbacteria bacterium RIFCSPLOWO2_01_FULL_48_16]|uniref:Glycosyltransferase 2-like domain-containing protein n=1 Tax=Candidatus Wildermuthbacteria bacterium RIFCSPLOWO2_01_FULL_48_16 TaxID=1802461 RepID=A0A1G2RL69_9BACT|nr:MAG: hypothetical protein A3J57_00675 [Candidatus Wildermuthbacteria bacterium RIFCSPHIGHO2_02_FULL_49_12b]OHA73603.1 MAG: hypothetical protein A3B24_00235 [Candidatus Wildermuthbacteria bacterium RIFCSPLOWO2_01_FULL_48_16]